MRSEARIALGRLSSTIHGFSGRDVALLAQEPPPAGGDLEDGTGVDRGDGGSNPGSAGFEPQAQGRFDVGCLGRVRSGADGIPPLAPGLGFARLEEGEVGLVVGEDAGHQFEIRCVAVLRVGFGQISVPGVPEGGVSPGPLLLAGRDVMVGNVDDPPWAR